jgi:hypothetical protein
MNVLKQFWADAVLTACFLINRMPLSVLAGVTPHSILFPSHSLFPVEPCIFCCTCFIRDVWPGVSKLDPKSLKCVFLGYSHLQKGYRCYSPELGRYLVSSNILFFETIPFFPMVKIYNCEGENLVYNITTTINHASSNNLVPIKPVITQVYSRRPPPDNSRPPPAPTSTDPSLDLSIVVRKGKRQCTHPISSFASYIHLFPSLRYFITSLDYVSVPKTLVEALSHPGWQAAMEEEMRALDDNGTWELVDLLARKQTIGCKWVYVVKVNPDGSVARLKSRLVAKGYAQTYGVDYSDTFSLVAKLASIRLFMSIAAANDWPLH